MKQHLDIINLLSTINHDVTIGVVFLLVYIYLFRTVMLCLIYTEYYTVFIYELGCIVSL